MSATDVEPDRVTALTEITTHAADGLALLLLQFKSKPYVEALLSAWLTQIQELETTFFDLLESGLLTATFAQLDQIGDILGRPRSGLVDDEYRIVLQGTALAIASSGTVPELWAIADIVLKLVTFTITEPQHATVKVEPDAAVAVGAQLLLEVLVRAKAAGVRLLVVDPRASVSSRFAFSSTSVTKTDANKGLSDVAASTGGRLVGILES